MGRHSLEDPQAYWKSFGFFVLKWLGIAAIPILAFWGIWRLMNQPDEPPVAAGVVRESPSASPSLAASPSPSPEESPSPTPSPAPSPSPPAVRSGKLQVLNGSATSGKGVRAADRLREAGYQIVAVQNASRRYSKTTIFYQPGFHAMAQEVAAVLGLGLVQTAPSNVSRQVPVTVVVGDDYKT